MPPEMRFTIHALCQCSGTEPRKFTAMKNEYTAIVKLDSEWWIGWIEEIQGVNCQEKSYKDLKETLTATLKEALRFQPVTAAMNSRL